MKTLLTFLFKLFFKVTVDNRGNFNHEKQLIIANHQSFLDGLLLALFLPMTLPTRPTFVVHTTVLNKWYFRMALSMVDYLAVDTTKPMAMKKVAHLVNSGKIVVIFPEGRITLTGSLMKIYDGTAFIAYKTGAHVTPVWIDGAIHTIFGRQKKLPRNWTHPIHLTILPGKKIELDESVYMMAKIKRQKAGEKMRLMMQDAMFASQPKETLYNRLLRTIKLYGKNHQIMWDKDHLLDSKLPALTYGDILKRVLGLGRLVSKVTQKGEYVGVLLPNVSTTPAAIFGLNINGRIPAMLNYTLGAQGLQSACETANIRTVITSRLFVEVFKLENTLASLKNIKIIYMEDVRKLLTTADKIWLMGYAVHFPGNFGQDQTLEDIAVVLFTSGSESIPKGVALSNRAFLANVDQCRTVLDLSPHDKFLNALPLFHSFGLTAGCFLPLLTGTPVVLYPSPLHYRIIPEVAYDKQCTILFGTNTFLNHYGKNANPVDFTSMRYVVAGAEKLVDDVRNMWFEKFGIRIFEGYGATECAPVLAVNTPKACKFGTVGQFMTHIEYKLLPVAGIEGAGELHVKGPNLMTGYLLHGSNGEITFPSSEAGEGWYNTGDIVEVNENGFVAIKGRMKRFIKIAGEMVPLEVVEKIAKAASEKFNHACVSRPDAAKGEALVLYTTDPELKRETLSKTANALGYSELMVARNIRFIEAIPILGTGKTDYVSLKKMAVEELTVTA
jgi:acyl-[acyl-carrier-protein]-phospholipid O-acyltransferase / long-chain-fatty-acid--[acyl-carrier-protein] ligase